MTTLTRNGYKVPKSTLENLDALRKELTVKPYVPSVFVNPRYVKKYPVYHETENFIYVPKQFDKTFIVNYNVQEYAK